MAENPHATPTPNGFRNSWVAFARNFARLEVFKSSGPCGLLGLEAVMVNPGLPHQTSEETRTIPVLPVLPLLTCGRSQGVMCELDKALPEIKPTQIIL